MKNYSIWKDLEVKKYPKLNDDKIVDVLIKPFSAYDVERVVSKMINK